MPAIVELIIDGNACKGCGVCVRLCPENVLVIADAYKVTPLFVEHCTNCKVCKIPCPEGGIEIVEGVKVHCEAMLL